MKQPEFIVNDGRGMEFPLSPYGYSALWGCDPCYDNPPRQKGDGYLFYNYSADSSKEELQAFSNAIDRTIEQVKERHDCCSEKDVEDLTTLKKWVLHQISS